MGVEECPGNEHNATHAQPGLLKTPDTRREAITSRPWLMASVGRRTEHAGQTTVKPTSMHAQFAQARVALMRVSALLQGFALRAAEQLNPPSVWQHVGDHLKRTLAGIVPPIQPALTGNVA